MNTPRPCLSGAFRVIEVCYNHPPEVFIARHIQALQTAGLSLQVVARHQAENYKAIASVGSGFDDLSVQIMPNFDHLSLSGRLGSLGHLFAAKQLPRFNQPLRAQVLLAFFRKLKPDLIHFHATGLAGMMRWIPETLGIPYTVSLRGSDVQVFPLRSSQELQDARAALLGATRIHTVSRNLGQVAERLVGSALELETIYTAVPVPNDLPFYDPDPFAELHFVSIGRIHWRKALPDLFVALRALLDRNRPAHLTIVGNGSDEPRLRYWIAQLGLASNVTLTGKLGSEQIRSLLHRAHAYVQSSVAEGFSNAVAEALAWGCPVFATDVGGTAEIIRDGENGFLLPPLKPEAWADKLELARDNKLMNRARTLGYETARQNFSPRVHAQAFARFYQRALENKKPLGDANRDRIHLPEPARPTQEIIITGQLQWDGGADQILRALANVTRPALTRIVLFGEGAQADELRYLARFLGFPPLEIFHGAALENLRAARKPQADLIVSLPDGTRRVWTMTNRAGQEWQSPFGEFEKLVGALRQMVESLAVAETMKVC